VRTVGFGSWLEMREACAASVAAPGGRYREGYLVVSSSLEWPAVCGSQLVASERAGGAGLSLVHCRQCTAGSALPVHCRLRPVPRVC
jgi:hypothetical protein